MFKNIVCFPHKLGQKKWGVEKAPSLFVDFLKNKSINNKSIAMNIHHVPCTNNDFFLNNNLKNLYNVNEEIPEYDFRLNVGGDHSMSIATVAYSLNKYPNCKVIWIDAHADINTYEKSETKNMHGMPLAYLSGLQNDNRFGFLQKKLPLENLLYIGLRSIDPYEQEVIDKYNIKIITSENINENIENSLEKIDNFIGKSFFHLSFDVDSIDPSVLYYTGTRVINGINKKAIMHLLYFLTQKKYLGRQLMNMDLTEMNPYIFGDPENETMNEMFEMVSMYKINV